MEIRKRCKGCQFWEHLEFDQGTCFFNPPAVLPDGEGGGRAVWPITNEDGRCSKWCPLGVPVSRDERLDELERCYDSLYRAHFRRGGHGSRRGSQGGDLFQELNSALWKQRIKVLEKAHDAVQERVATLEKKVARGDDLWRKGASTWEIRPAPAGGVRGLEIDGILFDELTTMKEASDANDQGGKVGQAEQGEEGPGEGCGAATEGPGTVARSAQESGAGESPRRDEEEGVQPQADDPESVSRSVRGVEKGIPLDPRTWKPYAK
jgi:hypothetical protein